MNIADNIMGLQHIGIPTNDIEKTKEFYNTLGFETIMETYNAESDEKVAFLKIGDLTIEIYENRQAVMHSGAIDHIALNVKDIDLAFVEVNTLGLKVLQDAPVYLPFWKNGIKYFIVEGINKEKIEFSQYL